ncbi:hypothetical protein L208DRAFT_1261199 [Tricholoma matsutake]|nr:hypothetical protein L208DRAFT_1261199 [Tricholoma matsutake 945]
MAKTNSFPSMLLKDTKKCCRDAQTTEMQSHLDLHLMEKPQKYTNEIFCEAAIEWLVSTDQPIQAFEHLSFRNMIHIAAHATNGVKIPDCHQT